MNSKRVLIWGSFIVIVGLVIWGLIAAEKKAAREREGVLLPDQVAASDHTWGSETAPATLVEYGDFQCPACGLYHPMLQRLLTDEGTSSLRFVFRHFPLSQHANAQAAAQAAEAAALQGKFWEMHDMLYEKQANWEKLGDPKTAFLEYAKVLGLDEKKFSEDSELQSVKDKVNNDYKSGLKARIDSTPTFFVNGKQIANIQSYDEFKKIIDDAALKAGSK